MQELKNRAIKAADAFVTRRGYEVLDSEWSAPEEEVKVDLVARDEDAIVFISVAARTQGDSLPEVDIDRTRLETTAAKWLAAHPESGTDVTVRFDAISLLAVGEDRALLRHHINCLGSGEVV